MEGWRSYHLYYHADRDLLLCELVRPLVESLLAEGRIASFFFVRFALGGPHIRLRLRVAPGCEREVAEAVELAAAGFFARRPSLQPLTEEEIRRDNGPILATDANETDDAVYPDNSLREAPVRFEVTRYGGPVLLGPSVDFFAVSSAQALHFLSAVAGQPRARQLPGVCRLLLCQACGFAADEEELLALLEYALAGWGRVLEPVVAEGDRLFERRRETFFSLVRGEIEELARAADPGPGSPLLLAEAARRLAHAIGDAGEVRRQIGMSQMHMTANRLGLLNPEEVYLGRALGRAARELAAADPAFWSGARDFLTERSRTPAQSGRHGLADRRMVAGRGAG